MNRKRDGVGIRGGRAGAVFFFAVATVIMAGVPEVRAQATPTALSLDVPAPEECLLEPRALPLFPEEAGQRAATPAPVVPGPAEPFSPPAGDPADAETVAAVTATVRAAIACRNAGDLLRAYTLFTDDMLVVLFGGPATVDPEVRQVAGEGPRPLPAARRLGIVVIRDIVLLPDGRVAAVVETATIRRLFRDYLFLVQEPTTGRWLIDEAIPLS
jgi:hypothetical protein